MDKKQAFAYLAADFKQYRAAYYYEGELSCTYVGETLVDHCNVPDQNAYEWAFEWVELVEAGNVPA